MLHVIKVERLGLLRDPLIKGAGGYKYYKRERYIDPKGKQRYRYWYHDDKQLQRHREELDPKGEHEHVLKHEAHKAHKTLRKDMTKTSSITEDVLKDLLRRGRSVKITQSFRKKNLKEFLDKEKDGGAPERNTLQRIKKALDMVPDEAKMFVSIRDLTIARRDDPKIKRMFEEDAQHPRPVPATYLSPRGGLVVCVDGEGMAGHAGANTNPVGSATFGSGLTLTEELIWHEMGQSIVKALKGRRRPMFKDWTNKIYHKGTLKISAAANQSVENDFAESFACMMSHPKQMARQCPERYEFFRENGLLKVPPIEEMLKEADDNLAWWLHEKNTKAKRVYNRLKEQTAGIEAPYESDMDEFYTLTIRGRTVYFRLGPSSRDEEEIWDPRPPVIDPKTGFPMYDKKVAPLFRQPQYYKEIYDEHGNRLTGDAAYYYLMQGHPKAEDSVPSNLDKYKADEQYTLPRLLFDKLGENRGDQKAETAAVKKYLKQGKLEDKRLGPIGGLDRWEYLPLKIDEGEFFAKTPTFKYGNMKSSDNQPYPMTDAKGKPLPALRTQSGKKVQAVHSRVYESPNPDGSMGSILVQETDDFRNGEVILGWGDKEDDISGKMVKGWTKITLDKKIHGKDLSTKALAAKWKVPIDELRRKNGRYGIHQIQDPILNTLINPMGKAIRNAHDLITMLRNAAEAQSEAWVSIQMSGEVPVSHVHAKVRFDGSGSPLLVGDYWKRKLGLENPRISDLTEGGTVKYTDRVRERTTGEHPMGVGKPIYAKIGDDYALSDLVEIVKDGKKSSYVVNVRANQAVKAGLTNVESVKRLPLTMDPDRPSVRMRQLQSPARDVQLYSDEMQLNGSGQPIYGTGLVKIKLPTDGMFGRVEMLRIPGVREQDGDLVLDTNRVDEFRERVGGFVMDDYVAYNLKEQMKKERAIAASTKTKKMRPSRIADPKSGAVNTKGLLKGCREILPWGDAFELGSHQLDGLLAAASNTKHQMSQLFAHNMGTGKTVTAICGIVMAQNLGKSKGRTFVSVPMQTAEEWVQTVSDFTHQNATMIGTMPGAKKIWSPPDNLKTKPPGWSDRRYHSTLKKLRDEAWASSDQYWKPHEDENKIIIVSDSYYQRHIDEMIRIGNFDYGVNDEAQGIQYENNDRSRAWDKLSEKALKGQLLLSGTPMTNNISTLVRYMKLLSQNTINYGSQKNFEDEFMVESSVMRANGARKAPKMDLNPAKAKKVLAEISPYIHVASSQDVENKVMPNIHLDENSPTDQSPIQAMLYRFWQGRMVQKDREQFAQAHVLGEDENAALQNDTARVSVLRARHITNTLAYSPTDNRKDITFEIRDLDGRVSKTVMLKMPGWDRFTTMYHGKWPSHRDVPNKMKPDEYNEFTRWAGVALGKNYESLAGKTIASTVSKQQLKSIKDSEPMNGIRFGSKVANPEYGPESFICRGVMKNGTISPIVHKVRNAKGKVIKTIEIPVGTRFIRGGDGLYWIGGLPEGHPLHGTVLNTWDWSNDVTVPAAAMAADGDSTSYKSGQKPLAEYASESVNRSPRLREQRLMMDLAATTGNAKTDEFEKYIRESTSPKTGNDPDTQFVHFGYAIGSSCRVMESKLRVMGYQDVNEALNDANRGDDGPPPTGKYFVTLFGGNASLGATAINSDIFRKGKGGSDQSMFVHRLMDGTTGAFKFSKDEAGVKRTVQFNEPYPLKVRDRIPKLFTDVECPARVVGIQTKKGIEKKYVYDSDLKATKQGQKDLKAIRSLERKGNRDAANKIYEKYLTDRAPLEKKHIGVFNNCQHMIASDAAQTGMNWGNATRLSNYDSLFSPMNEAQRFARVARMLDAFVAKKLQPSFDLINARIEKMGKATKFAEYADDKDSVRSIVADVLDKMPKVTARIDELLREKGSSYHAETIAETYLAQRALDRMTAMRPMVEQKLRQAGRTLVNSPMAPDPETGEMRHQYIKAEEIVGNDVTNEIIENYLMPFERELLRSRKGIVNVKRFLTTVEVPEFRRERVTVNGRTKMEEVPTGNMTREFPSNAEKSVLTRGRAKQVPMEGLFAALQKQWPEDTKFDYLSGSVLGLSHFHRGEENVLTPQERAEKNKLSRMRQKAQAKSNAAAKKNARKVAIERRKREAKERAKK